jgi:Protein of unknown function (DUF1232)
VPAAAAVGARHLFRGTYSGPRPPGLSLDRDVPGSARALIGGTLAYFILPIDLQDLTTSARSLLGENLDNKVKNLLRRRGVDVE